MDFLCNYKKCTAVVRIKYNGNRFFLIPIKRIGTFPLLQAASGHKKNEGKFQTFPTQILNHSQYYNDIFVSTFTLFLLK